MTLVKKSEIKKKLVITSIFCQTNVYFIILFLFSKIYCHTQKKKYIILKK